MVTTMLTATVELNHFYLAIDHETYAAIEGSDFLKTEFAAFEKRTTVRTDKTYTAMYFYGTHTYFEFFDAEAEKRKPGESGIAYGVDAAAAEPKSISLEKDLITRQWQGVQVPWFYTLSAHNEKGIALWLMEYHPDFLAKWHPSISPADGITREAILSRYKAVLAQKPADPILEDVAGLTVALAPEERPPVERWIRDIGSEVPVHFIEPEAGEQGIREVRFKLRRVAAKISEMHFGKKSILRFQPDGTAIWAF
jgi:hypothetical protein